MSKHEAFFAELERAVVVRDPAWLPLYRQADNLRKFVDGVEPRHYTSAYVGYQVGIHGEELRSSFVVYAPRRLELIAEFEALVQTQWANLKAGYGETLERDRNARGTGAGLLERIAYSPGEVERAQLIDWVVASQRRLRLVLAATHIDVAALRRSLAT